LISINGFNRLSPQQWILTGRIQSDVFTDFAFSTFVISLIH